jgi:2-oxo-4-hydroxy-4-carboxy--5-ureidoimidazoline (OHCU) decarboxylase
MKTPSLIAIIILSLSLSSALAQQSADTDTDADTPAMPMLQNMEEMQALMEKMAQTDDPAERRKLMQEHRQKMQQTMGIMRGMHGMMDPDSNRGPRRGRDRMHDSEHEAMMGLSEAYRQMDKRLDLIQSMLEQLLKQED